MKILGVIPARYASTRFPGKPLVMISGKTMIQRVYEQCSKAVSLNDLLIATDDERIFDHVSEIGGKVMMTAATHRTGTERCNEVMKEMRVSGQHYDVVINIQGDEPYINPLQIDKVAGCFTKPTVTIATLRKQINSQDELFNPNIIKVICNADGRAIYFSRSAIPYLRGHQTEEWISSHSFYKHIGIYAYRSAILEKICQLEPTALEAAESLEQLRWLENDYRIIAEITETESHAIDTPEDLRKLL